MQRHISTKKIQLSLLLVGLVIAEAQGQAISLDTILGRIRINHPAMKMYDAGIRSMDEAAKGAKSWMAPEIGTGFWMTPYDPSLWKSQPGGASGMGQYMISVQQMIPNSAEQSANERYMQAISSADRENRQTALHDYFALAKKSYYAWIIDLSRLRLLGENEQILNFMIQSAEMRYKNNLGKLDAYYKAKAALGRIAYQRIQIENDIRQEQIILNRLMNREGNISFTIDTSYTLKDYEPVDTGYFTNTRSDIRAIDKTILITGLEQEVQRARLKPQFGLRYDNMFGFGGLPMQFSLMAMVKLPIAGWSSKVYKAGVESLNWKIASLRASKEMALNQATSEQEALLASITGKKKQAEIFQRNIIPALVRNFQSMQLAYEQNTGELFELFDAWESLTMARMEYLDQLGDLLKMQAEMDRILEKQ